MNLMKSPFAAILLCLSLVSITALAQSRAVFR